METNEEPSKESMEIIGKFVKDTGTDIKTIQERWVESSVKDEPMRLIHCAILSDPEALRLYNSWGEYDLEKFGIADVYDIWKDAIEKNQDKIKTERDAIYIVHAFLVERLRSASKTFTGVILAVGMKRDNLADFIIQTLDGYKADPERAIKYGMVKVFNDMEALKAEHPDIESKISDKYFINSQYVIPIGKKTITLTRRDGKQVTKKDWFGGRYDGKPVVGSAHMQTITVLGREKAEDKYKCYEMILGDTTCDVEKPRNCIVKFEANVSPTDKSRLNPISRTTFVKVGEIEDYKEIQEALNRKRVEIDDLHEYVTKTNGKSYDTKVVKVKVLDVYVTDTTTTLLAGSPKEKSFDEMGTLFDAKGKLKDTSYYFTVSEGIEINFGKGSIIDCIGSPGFGSKRIGDKWEQDTATCKMWVNGTIVPKNQQVESVNINVPQADIDVTKWAEAKKEDDTPPKETLVEKKEKEVIPEAEETPKEEQTTVTVDDKESNTAVTWKFPPK